VTGPANPDQVRDYTVCGLIVDQDPPEAWSGVTYGVQALDADGAVGFCQVEATGQPSDDGRLLSLGLAVACVHPGDVDRVGWIESAYEEVTVGDLEDVDGGELLLFTVCGVDQATWRTLCYQGGAPHWLTAYVQARDAAERDGYRLLHAATHAGWVDRIVGFDWADPSVDGEAGMRQVAEGWGAR
jgi:hypothetical protein